MFTVCIPAFNAGPFIQAALNSLARQTCLPTAVWVIDDASTDDTARQVQDFQAPFPLFLVRLPDNQGEAGARNAALKAATDADGIVWLDADDVADPTMLETLGALTQQHPNAVLVHGAWLQTDADGQPLCVLDSGPMPQAVFGAQIVRNRLISPSGVWVHRATLQAVGGFNPAFRLACDWDAWLRLAKTGQPWASVSQPLVRLRRHGGNASAQLAAMHGAEQQILAQYPLADLLAAIPDPADAVGVCFRVQAWDAGESLLATLPPSAPVHFWRGVLSLHQQQWAPAESAFRAVLQLDAQHGAALNNLGALCQLRGAKAEGRALLSLALKLFPGYQDAEHNLRQGADAPRFTGRPLRPQLLHYEIGLTQTVPDRGDNKEKGSKDERAYK